MAFTPSERQALLRLKGVGPTVVVRLEQLGYDNVARLAAAHPLDVLSRAAQAVGSTCWKNSPQARAAITAAVEWARGQHAAR